MVLFFLTVLVLALIAAFALTPRSWSLWHAGVHTEYAGTGRVRFVSFFRGAGYCVVLRRGRGRDGRPLDAPGWRPNITIRGFTFYWRTKKSSRRASYGKPVRWIRLTTNANLGAC